MKLKGKPEEEPKAEPNKEPKAKPKVVARELLWIEIEAVWALTNAIATLQGITFRDKLRRDNAKIIEELAKLRDRHLKNMKIKSYPQFIALMSYSGGGDPILIIGKPEEELSGKRKPGSIERASAKKAVVKEGGKVNENKVS